MARVPSLRQSDLPEEYQYLLSEDALGERNIFRALGNNPAVLQSYMRYGTTLWKDDGLTNRERELVILAVARALDARYEWQQHVELGLDAGVEPWAITAVGSGDLDALDDRDRALIEYGQAFAAAGITETEHDAVAQHLDDAGVVALAMLAGHYVATAGALNALDVSLESDFVGWTPNLD